MFAKVLIANRGEIAVRVIRACREMDIATVAVYSDADAAAPHAWLADEAVRLGPAEPAQSYLHIGRIIDAARATGAQAIHPGYGFLAENAAFASACRDAGIAFIGPPAEVIAALGDKAAARRLADSTGVPVVPGVNEPLADDDAIRRAAQRVGYPVLLKAAAGGGGKGMRAVHRPDDLDAAAASARREAVFAFGDGALIVERLLEGSRHVEVQILADARGSLVHLGERECSVQRRHQKVVEESPSPAADARLRQAMGDAALRIARAAGYINAGTVEFLVDQDKKFYFLEVNTRLQVEHAVTELVTGIDLVAAQIRIAAGEPLPVRQDRVHLRGHALECRVYAEDPAAGFAPSPGRVLRLVEPQLPGVRVDSGIRAGQDIPMEYDPILAKVVAWAPDRQQAVRKMIQALSEYVILGVHTSIPYLRAVVAHPAFAAGELSTDFLDRHFAGWRRSEPTAEVRAIAALVSEAAVAPPGGLQPGSAPQAEPRRFADPWDRLTGWRMGWRIGNREITLSLQPLGDGVYAVTGGGRRMVVYHATDPSRQYLHVDGEVFTFRRGRDEPDPQAASARRYDLRAPMPGIVTRILVTQGQVVAEGAPLFVLEAMKMETVIRAVAASVVTGIRAAPGARVDGGAVVVEVDHLPGEPT